MFNDISDQTRINNYQVQNIIILIHKAQFTFSSMMNYLANEG